MEHVTQAANTIHMMYLCASLGKAAERDGFISIRDYAADRYIFYRDASNEKIMPWEEVK